MSQRETQLNHMADRDEQGAADGSSVAVDSNDGEADPIVAVPDVAGADDPPSHEVPPRVAPPLFSLFFFIYTAPELPLPTNAEQPGTCKQFLRPFPFVHLHVGSRVYVTSCTLLRIQNFPLLIHCRFTLN